MNQLISEFIKGKLSKRKKGLNEDINIENESDEELSNVAKEVHDRNEDGLNSGFTDEPLNRIEEETSTLGSEEDKVREAVHDETNINAKSNDTFASKRLQQLRNRVSSLPDLRLRTFSQNKNNQSSSEGSSSTVRSEKREDNAAKLRSSSTQTLRNHKSKTKLKRWLHLSESAKPELDVQTADGILKQKISIPIAASSPDNISISSSFRSRSTSHSISCSASFKNSRDFSMLSATSRSKSNEFLVNRTSGFRMSSSSGTDSVIKASVGHTREASFDSLNGNGYSQQLNIRRRRSKTVGTIDHDTGKNLKQNNSNFQSDIARVRSNSSSNIYTNPVISQRNITSLSSRRSNSFVTTLTNLVSLRSMTGIHSPKQHLPTQIPYDALGKPPKPTLEDTEETYLQKIIPTYQKYLALVLCSTSDNFLHSCLELYLDTEFQFHDEPLDLALRKMLLFLELPREGQQIDRLLRCFSSIYFKQNSNFTEERRGNMWLNMDQVFFITYSLLVLHTDSFNANNRNKITKEEFVKLIHNDTESSGKLVPKEYIEYLFDNITAKEFPQAILPPYEIDESLSQEENSTEFWHVDRYCPEELIKSQWLSQRSVLISSNKNSSGSNQYPLTPPVLPLGVSSSASSSISLSYIDDIEPYHHIVNDTEHNIYLKNFFDSVPNKSLPAAPSLDSTLLNKYLSLLKEIKGGYLKFNKSQLLRILNEFNYETLSENEDNPVGYLKIIRMGEVEMKISTRKFSLVGNTVRSQWRTKFAILTTSFLIFFDDMAWMNPVSEFDENTQTSNYIIDLSQSYCPPYEIDHCNSLFVKESDADPRILNTFNQNKKHELMFRDSSEALSWKEAIYFVGSIEGCQMEVDGISNTFIAERRMTLYEKLTKLETNRKQNISKWESLHHQKDFYMKTAPLSNKTRSVLIDHVHAIIRRIEMVSYQIERLDIYILTLNLILRLEPSLSEYVTSDGNSIDESFLFSQYSRKSIAF